MLAAVRSFLLIPGRHYLGVVRRIVVATNLRTDELKNLVDHVEPEFDSWKFEDPAFAATLSTSHRNDVKLHLTNLGRSFSQLRFTYGMSRGTLEEFLEKQLRSVAKSLPQCKLIKSESVIGYWTHLSDQIISYGRTQGLQLDEEKDPEMVPGLYQLIVDFGKEMSGKYPIIFRDMYLICAHDINNIKKKTSLHRHFKSGPLHSSAEQAIQELGEENWHFSRHPAVTISGKQYDVDFIRRLNKTPFDPITGSDDVDPELQGKAWEKVGLLFASAPFSWLRVMDGPVPVPII